MLLAVAPREFRRLDSHGDKARVGIGKRLFRRGLDLLDCPVLQVCGELPREGIMDLEEDFDLLCGSHATPFRDKPKEALAALLATI